MGGLSSTLIMVFAAPQRWLSVSLQKEEEMSFISAPKSFSFPFVGNGYTDTYQALTAFHPWVDH